MLVYIGQVYTEPVWYDVPANIKAILENAQTSYELGKRGRQISICSDSRTALAALASPRMDLKLVKE